MATVAKSRHVCDWCVHLKYTVSIRWLIIYFSVLLFPPETKSPKVHSILIHIPRGIAVLFKDVGEKVDSLVVGIHGRRGRNDQSAESKDQNSTIDNIYI